MKIAICLSGAPRDFNTCLPSIKKYLIQDNDVDFFLHLWDSTKKVEDINYNFKWKNYGGDNNRIIDLLKPKKYIIDTFNKDWEEIILKESKINISKLNTQEEKNYGFNCCSMYYKIKLCYELVEEYMKETGINYDLVIRARFDFLWEKYINFDNFDENKLYLIKDRYATASKLVTNDKYFAGSPKIMKIMCNLFDNISLYQSLGVKLDGQVINEYHIKYNKLNFAWLGDPNTYYKCMPRHSIIYKTRYIVINNFNNDDFISELSYNILYEGCQLFVDNKTIKKTEYLNFFRNFNYYNKQDLEHFIVIDYINNQNSDYLELKFNNNIIKTHKKLLNTNLQNIINFIISIINNRVTKRNFLFVTSKNITNLKENEILIYKYSDKGYYQVKLLSNELDNSYIIQFDKDKKKIKRNDFIIKNIFEYYEEFILPY